MLKITYKLHLITS